MVTVTVVLQNFMKGELRCLQEYSVLRHAGEQELSEQCVNFAPELAEGQTATQEVALVAEVTDKERS